MDINDNIVPVSAPTDNSEGSISGGDYAQVPDTQEGTSPTPSANGDYEYDSPGGNPFAGSNNPFANGGGASGFGGGILGDPLAPDEGYEYDFGSSGNPMRTPFDGLIGLPGIDNIGDIFADADMGDNPFAGGGAPVSSGTSSGGNPFAGDIAPASSGSSFGGSLGNNFGDMDPDSGVGNTDNGNGNWFIGESEGETGSNNQADGNGNWFLGNNNQAEGNGNWYLVGEDSTPFNNQFAGENNPLTGGNPLGFGEGDVPLDSMGGSNNPVFAGGSTTPAPVGNSGTPDTATNPVGNDNTTTGNGNWYLSEGNITDGNGNWYFGSGNITEGNGNWSLGDNNQVSGNGNRPTGGDNTITGNGNQPTGSGNTVTGNRQTTDEDDLLIYGNGDRYFAQDEDGNVFLVSDESASDPNMTFDFNEVVGASSVGNSTTPIDLDFFQSIAGSGSSSGESLFPAADAGSLA